jgi:hypothetical protein
VFQRPDLDQQAKAAGRAWRADEQLDQFRRDPFGGHGGERGGVALHRVPGRRVRFEIEPRDEAGAAQDAQRILDQPGVRVAHRP